MKVDGYADFWGIKKGPKQVKAIKVNHIYLEDETGSLHSITRKKTIYKDSEMTATMKDGRRVWYFVEQGVWGIPYRSAKGEVKL
jgi:hypothetical protein